MTNHGPKPARFTRMDTNRLLRIGLILFSCSAPLRAAEPDLRELLRDALYTEEVTRDSEKAATQYEEILARHDERKQFAASALFRLAEVRRKQDRRDEAVKLYQRLIAEFSNAGTETRLARENLAALGGKMPEAEGAEMDEEAREIARLQKLARTSPDLALSTSELADAVNNNRPRVVAYLLEAGASVGAGEPLVWAARRGHLEVLKVLLEKSPGLAESEGPKALAGAVMADHLEVVRALLAAKVDANWQPDTCAAPPPAGTGVTELPGTPLMMAIHLQNQTMIDLLLDSGADVKRAASGTGFTALHLAAGRTAKDAPALVERLIKLGADVNALSEVLHQTNRVIPVPPEGRTVWKISPLQYAVDREAWDCAKALIRHGADLKAERLVSFFVDGGIDEKDHGKIRFLIENGADAKQPALLTRLIRQGPEAVPLIKDLLEAGCDPNAVDQAGVPPIVRVFEWDLINAGNANQRSARHGKQVELIQLLLKHGADPNTTCGGFSRGPTRSGTSYRQSNFSPFVEDTDKPGSYPENLLMMVITKLSNNQRMNNVGLIKILLDAGAKPTHEFPEVFDFVAKGDDSLPIAKALLPFRPQTLELDRAGYFFNWNPQVKRLFLDEVLNPALAGSGGIYLVDGDRGGCSKLLEANQEIPPMAELMLGNIRALLDYYSEFAGKRHEPVITRVRRDAAGQWSRESIDLRSDAALPDLASGDIIELAKGKPLPDSENTHEAFHKLLSWHFRKRVSFPVTVEIGGKLREIRLRGDLLAYDPTKNEAPLLSAGHLAMLFLPASADSVVSGLKPDSILSVRRQGGGDVRMDLAATGAREFSLQKGDRLILPDPELVLGQTDRLLRPARLVVPDFSFSRTYHPAFDLPNPDKPGFAMPTLIQVLADACSMHWPTSPADRDQPLESRFSELSNRLGYGMVPVILPHPDFSRIRIRRTGDDGKELTMEVDLGEAIRQCGDDTPAAEAGKADVALFPGDLVELPLKTDQPDQAWKGFTPEEERFFRKALAGTVMIRKQDGIIESVTISYHQPEWKTTPHGLVPLAPAKGVSGTRLFLLTGMGGSNTVLKRDGLELKVASENPVLRDGDEIRVDMPVLQPAGHIPPRQQRGARPRVVPPPDPSSH